MNREQTMAGYRALRGGVGTVFLLAGADKFTHFMLEWPRFLGPLATWAVPLAPSDLMDVVGLFEVAVGVTLLAGYTRIFGWVGVSWLGLVTVNLITSGRHFGMTAFNLMLCGVTYALIQLAEEVEPPVFPRRRRRRPAEQMQPPRLRHAHDGAAAQVQMHL